MRVPRQNSICISYLTNTAICVVQLHVSAKEILGLYLSSEVWVLAYMQNDKSAYSQKEISQ
jgi:hypothetical protein